MPLKVPKPFLLKLHSKFIRNEYYKIDLLLIGSARSLEGSRESTPSANALSKKYENDIEVLSNPSQSSIEVLDDTSR